MHAGVLQRPLDLGTEHVPGHAHDEQFAESGVEQQLGRHRLSLQPRMLAKGCWPGKFGQDFLLHGREARGSAYEAFVALLQAIERLLRGVVSRDDARRSRLAIPLQIGHGRLADALSQDKQLALERNLR